jgi:mRNA interferase HigB
VRIIGRDIVDAFQRRHPPSRKPLEAWVALMSGNDFGRFADVRGLFRSADYVAPVTVFDVGGNKYRLIARVDYGLRAVAVHAVLTHEEYDRERWKP